MRRFTALILMVLLALSLPAAVSESGKDAYELGRAVVGILSSDTHGPRTREDDDLVESIEQFRPEWDKLRFERYFDILEEAGIEKPAAIGPASRAWRTGPDLLGVEGRLLSASSEISGSAAWFHTKAMGYKVTYAKDGEVLEYALDGDIYFFMYINGSNADILVECEHLKAGDRDLRDARLEVSADLGSWDIEARYNGKELTPDDMEAFAPIVKRAAMFF